MWWERLVVHLRGRELLRPRPPQLPRRFESPAEPLGVRGLLEWIRGRDVPFVHRSSELLEHGERLAGEGLVSREPRQDDLPLSRAHVRRIEADRTPQALRRALEVALEEVPQPEIGLDDLGVAVERIHAIDVALLGDGALEISGEARDASRGGVRPGGR